MLADIAAISGLKAARRIRSFIHLLRMSANRPGSRAVIRTKNLSLVPLHIRQEHAEHPEKRYNRDNLVDSLNADPVSCPAERRCTDAPNTEGKAKE